MALCGCWRPCTALAALVALCAPLTGASVLGDVDAIKRRVAFPVPPRRVFECLYAAIMAHGFVAALFDVQAANCFRVYFYVRREKNRPCDV